jgi:anti-anti-sigma factor
MVLLGSSFFTVSDRPISGRNETGAGPIIVWLVGEHDLSTDDALCLTLARAISLDSAGLVLDMSQVTFMAASTLGVIARARDFLRQRSRSLTVRSPSAPVGRVVLACGLSALIRPSLATVVESTELAGDEGAEALATWVAVPPAERAGGPTAPSPRGPEHIAARVGGAAVDLEGGVVSVEGLAESG